jgi:hypothetical protein
MQHKILPLVGMLEIKGTPVNLTFSISLMTYSQVNQSEKKLLIEHVLYFHSVGANDELSKENSVNYRVLFFDFIFSRAIRI